MDASVTRPSSSNRTFFALNAIASAAALSLLFWLLVFHKGTANTGWDLRFMPAVNAGLNSLSAGLLLSGWVAIKRKRSDLHRNFMIGAFSSSSLFLVGYLAYHYIHGDTKYVGAFRGIYLSLLASHVLLSMAILPMAFTAFYFAWKRRFDSHKRVTRILFPIWVYVSITGVLVFFMLRGSIPAVP